MSERTPPEPESIQSTRFSFSVSHGADPDGLKVRWGGREVLWHEIPIPTPAFPFAMVKLCTDGAGLFVSGRQRWEISPGTLFWSFPQQETLLTAVKGIGMVNLGVALSGKSVPQEVERFLHVPVGTMQLAEIHPVKSILDEIMNEGLGRGEHREDICAQLASVLLRRIDALSVASSHANSLARKTFRRCREYVEQHFATLTSLREVARDCNVTVPYLCRLFDQFFESSPYEYLTRLKMRYAERLLFQSDDAISEVAATVGYKDPGLFARNFKAAFGQNPAAYRRSNSAWSRALQFNEVQPIEPPGSTNID